MAGRRRKLEFSDIEDNLSEACLDLSREDRTGIPEVILAAYKTTEQVDKIINRLLEKNGFALATKVNSKTARLLLIKYPDAVYNETAKTFFAGKSKKTVDQSRLVIVLTAGTSDLPVALEAVEVLKAFSINHRIIVDAGVAGLHRLLNRLDELRQADVIIAIAGMEGALPSVVAGLVCAPVIAVPTSIGYGANLGGISALLGMLNSCAPGIATVNIDNGFGAAVMAAKMINCRSTPT